MQNIDYDINIIIQMLIYAGFSGITVFFGGLISKFVGDKLNEQVNHFLVAFGGGIILAALALVLIPKGMEKLDLSTIIILFIVGGISFLILDEKLERGGSQVSQLLAMLLDFVPEAIALGATFATDKNTGILLAIFIGLQNLPESFNSYKDLINSGFKSKKALLILFFLSFSGVIGAIIGHQFLSDKPEFTSGLMIFASSGILYLVFQDIAPNVRLKNSWIPPLGANIGFLIGIIGEKLIK